MPWLTILLIAAAFGLSPVARAADRAAPVVAQKGKVFAPASLTVKVNETITFRNDDDVTHNVFSNTPGATFLLRAQAPGTEDKVAFERVGQVQVRCAIHPTMKLDITVQ